MSASKIYNADCMDPEIGLPSYPENHFDLAIVDPPYGIGMDGRNNHTRSSLAKSNDYRSGARYDNCAPDADYFSELLRVSKNQIVWGANHFISRLPFDSSCWIVWDKVNGQNDFADCELAWTSFNTAVRKAHFRWNGMLQQDMKNKEIRLHPNQKPKALYRWILDRYANPGDLILDTHVGSASSLIACESMGFEYVGYELDTDYYWRQKDCRMAKGISKCKIL
jgi:site-specific DNA-methyltransferase (adenine-specific)